MSEVRLEPTAEEIERVANAIYQGAWADGYLSEADYVQEHYRDMARAAILAMDRRASPTAEPLYRFLTPGEIIQHGDECPDDQAHLWVPITGVFIGMRYGGAMKTARRRASPPAAAVAVGRLMNAQAIELAIWRKSYPIQAMYIGEEARAKSEGREPREIPPIAIGAAKSAGIQVREG